MLRALLRRTGVTTVDSGAQLGRRLGAGRQPRDKAGEPVSLTSTEFERWVVRDAQLQAGAEQAQTWTAS